MRFFNQKNSCLPSSTLTSVYLWGQPTSLFIILCIELNGFWLVQQKTSSFLKSSLRGCFCSTIHAWTDMGSTRSLTQAVHEASSSFFFFAENWVFWTSGFLSWTKPPNIFWSLPVLTRKLSTEEVCLWKDILDSFICSQQKQPLFLAALIDFYFLFIILKLNKS